MVWNESVSPHSGGIFELTVNTASHSLSVYLVPQSWHSCLWVPMRQRHAETHTGSCCDIQFERVGAIFLIVKVYDVLVPGLEHLIFRRPACSIHFTNRRLWRIIIKTYRNHGAQRLQWWAWERRRGRSWRRSRGTCEEKAFRQEVEGVYWIQRTILAKPVDKNGSASSNSCYANAIIRTPTNRSVPWAHSSCSLKVTAWT